MATRAVPIPTSPSKRLSSTSPSHYAPSKPYSKPASTPFLLDPDSFLAQQKRVASYSPRHHSNPAKAVSHVDVDEAEADTDFACSSAASSTPSSPRVDSPSFASTLPTSTPPSVASLDHRDVDEEEAEGEEYDDEVAGFQELSFPTYVAPTHASTFADDTSSEATDTTPLSAISSTSTSTSTTTTTATNPTPVSTSGSVRRSVPPPSPPPSAEDTEEDEEEEIDPIDYVDDTVSDPLAFTPVLSRVQSSPAEPPPQPPPALPSLQHLFSSLKPADDSDVQDEPSKQVDYLSHNWLEQDIWQSWRHIVANRKIYGERSRLENASWRTWTKAKYRLPTVPPEKLNWMKDCDVTWLYGPLQEGRQLGEGKWPRSAQMANPSFLLSEPSSRLPKSDSFLNPSKKTILKKRSVSEVMLQKSLSSSSLLKQAAAAVEAQRRRGHRHTSTLSRSASELMNQHSGSSTSIAGPTSMLSSSTHSGQQSPEHAGGGSGGAGAGGGRRHIRFHNTVEQCIAVDFKESDEGEYDDGDDDYASEDDTPPSWTAGDGEASSSEDDMIMMKQSYTRTAGGPGSSSHSRRESFAQEGKGIAMLPSTTLKFHHDEFDCPGHADDGYGVAEEGGAAITAQHHGRPRLQQSSSQETLRPQRPSANFLIGEGEEEWEPSGAYSGHGGVDTPRPGSSAGRAGDGEDYTDDDEGSAPAGLRRTASGMFMPVDDDDDEHRLGGNGILGRVVDTVNTARDIFSVIVNVGWRS